MWLNIEEIDQIVKIKTWDTLKPIPQIPGYEK